MKMVMRTLDERGIKVGEGSKLLFGGEDILAMDAKALLDLRRRKISMISQSPMAALNPVFTIGQQMMDVLKYSGQFDKHDKKGMLDAARKAIDSVMIPDPDRILNSYPHQLSGGMRQRICIATSLLTPRQLLIADEPGTALDVTVQGQIHKLLRRLVEEEKRSLIMITHSLGVVRELVDRIYVMYAGNIVENCDTAELFKNPLLAKFLRSFGTISVNRGTVDLHSITATIEVLRSGGYIGLFPQGTRMPDKEPSAEDVKSGVGLIAYRAKSNVLPVYIQTKNNRIRLFRPVTVIIGKPILYDELGFEKGGMAEYDAASKRIFERILEIGKAAENGDHHENQNG